MNRDFAARHVITVIKPQLLTGATAVSGWLAMTDAVRLFTLINIGATDVKVDAKLQQATTSTGTGAKDIDGAALTQFAEDEGEQYASIDLEAAALDINHGFAFVQLSITADPGPEPEEGQPAWTGAQVEATLMRTCRHAPPTQPTAYKEKVVIAG